jgi:hypothetical protein
MEASMIRRILRQPVTCAHAEGVALGRSITERLLRRRWIPDAIIVAFFLMQALDGALTYVGILTFGPEAEGNPLISLLIARFGEVAALLGAKTAAAGFGVVLHLTGVHRVIALLTGLYFGAAILPWTLILLLF